MRFFPIVPRNVPPDDLAKYLEPWDQERAALVSVMEDSAAGRITNFHPEWDINPPPPVMRAGWGPSGHRVAQYGLGGLRAVGQPIGDDPTRLSNLQAGTQIVNGTWAQRAANAMLSPLGASLIQVDGSVGTQTLTALRFAMLRWYAAQSHTAVEPDSGQSNISGIPMPARSGAGVAVPSEFYNYLKALIQVPDPARTSSPSGSGSSSGSPSGAASGDDPSIVQPSPPPSTSTGVGLTLLAIAATAWFFTRR